MPQFETDVSAISAEVQRIRFTGQSTDVINAWVMAAYAELWHAADWPWKFIELSGVVAASSNEVVLQDVGSIDPGEWTGSDDLFGVNRVLDLWDEDSFRLQYVNPREYNDLSYLDSANTGSPEVWSDKWSYTRVAAPNQPTIVVGPWADTETTLTVRVELHPSQPASSGSSAPVPFEWQFPLIYGAMAIGLRLENDPTWRSVREMFQETIANMLNANLPTLHENRSYGGRENLVDGGW